MYHQTEVEALCKDFFSDPSTGDSVHARLSKHVDAAVERFKALDEQDRDDFAGWVQSFRNLYGYLSQIIPYQDSSLERAYTYLRFLGAKLPRAKQGDRFEPDGEVGLKYYKLQKIGEGQVDLKIGEADPLYGPDEVGSRLADSKKVRLSTLVDGLN